jgi:phosphosulfolactate synthase
LIKDKPANGWGLDFAFPLQSRVFAKPRTEGITMILDKGSGLRETQDILEMSADYIDFWKLSFGSSALYNPTLLSKKIEIIKSYDIHVYPGGTFLEIAYIQGKLKAYLKRAFELGFTSIEISDGTINVVPWQRSQIIKTACETGLLVVTEIGKKDCSEVFNPEQMAEQVGRDIDDGAFKVIVEARESGMGVTIFNEKGNIEQEKLNKFLMTVSHQEQIIWEAPLKKQQVDFITMFGLNVNLGNISPQEIIALESLRAGLRADTFKLSLAESEKKQAKFY